MPIEPHMGDSRKAYLALAAAVAIALALQVAIIARSTVISADGITFINFARALPENPAQAFRLNDQHPGYPVMILAAMRANEYLGGDTSIDAWVLAAQVVSSICGLLLIIVVWWYAKSMFDARVAAVTALIMAVLPLMRRNASDALSDTPHLLFYLVAVCACCEWLRSQRATWLVVGGVASGLAFWIRPEGLEVALVAAAVVFCQLIRGRSSLRRTALDFSLLAIAVLVVVTPYMWTARKLTSKQITFAKRQPASLYIVDQSHEEEPAVKAANPQPITIADQHAAINVALVLRLALRGGNEFINSISQGFKFIFIPFYFLGHVELWRRRMNSWQFTLVAALGAFHILVLFGVFFVSGYIGQRHVMPAVALALPFTALGVFWMADKLSGLFGPAQAKNWIVAGLVGVSSAVVLPWTLRSLNLEFNGVLHALAWIELHTEAQDGVLSNSPYVPFYSSRPTAFLGPGEPTVGDALARAPHVATCPYAVVHMHAYGFRPQWIADIDARYAEVMRIDDPRGSHRDTKVVIYRSKTASGRDELTTALQKRASR